MMVLYVVTWLGAQFGNSETWDSERPTVRLPSRLQSFKHFFVLKPRMAVYHTVVFASLITIPLVQNSTVQYSTVQYLFSLDCCTMNDDLGHNMFNDNTTIPYLINAMNDNHDLFEAF
eukprot:scaffold14818_cov147-Amphora_coffeaeformis.AAC.1